MIDDELVCSEWGCQLGIEVEGYAPLLPRLCSCCESRVVQIGDDEG